MSAEGSPISLALCADGKHIEVSWPFDRTTLATFKRLPGRRWVKERKVWLIPLDLECCRMMRDLFGSRLVLSQPLKDWAWQARKVSDGLGKIALADNGALATLSTQYMPKMFRALYYGPLGRYATVELGYTTEQLDAWLGFLCWLRGLPMWSPEGGSYQTADVRFMADSQSSGNFNHPGLGKTLEWLAAIFEAGLEKGDHLVVAPSAAVDGTWEGEAEFWCAEYPGSVEVFACTGTRAQREAALTRWRASSADVRFVVVNPQMLQYRKTEERTQVAFKAKPKEERQACHCPRLKDPHWHYASPYPTLMDHEWRTYCNDETHKGSIRNHRSITAHGLNAVKVVAGGKRTAMSGTPMKKKGADIWGTLHYLRPDVFTSYWRFAEMFFAITDNGYGKVVGELREEMEGSFFRSLAPYVVRRTKDECLPWLPAKQYVPVWVSMDDFPKQAKQYAQMLNDGIAETDSDAITSTSTLAEFTRLGQFANAYCELDGNGKVVPTLHSAKLEALWGKLEEHGIFDQTSDEQTVIFSQYREMVELVAAELVKRGVSTQVVSGKQNKQGQRRAIKEAFQAGETKVLCIVTTAGGVSLTLDAADTAHFIDEMWAPDEQEQAEDRIHRASRIHQVTIYQYRTMNTIDQYKMETAADKEAAQKYILDVRRQLLKEQAA